MHLSVMQICLLYTLMVATTETARRRNSAVRSLELHATKGKFFIHTLHSANFFSTAVDVKWSATVKGRPSLPLWLHLMPSRHKVLAYLYGTPVTPAIQIVIHAIARRTDNFETAQQFITIFFNNDGNRVLACGARYNASTQQVVELRVKNYDAEEFINGRSGLIEKMHTSLKDSFRGKGINPYIFDVIPAVNAPPEKTHFIRDHKFGAIIQVGTQKRFHTNVLNLERGLQTNSQYCTRNPLVPLDKYFAPTFQIDWCNFHVKNVTMMQLGDERDAPRARLLAAVLNEENEQSTPLLSTEATLMSEEPSAIRTRYYFWESFLMFPMLGVCCILLLILLSVIFFGRREGQHWRDYKTPKEQLDEYISVREGQRHLRELSVQRQILQMASDRAPSSTPVGIHTFLQPRSSIQTVSQNNNPPGNYVHHGSRSPILKEDRRHASIDVDKRSAMDVHNMPIGKQTVAEAAKACGSSLHLYRNPFEDEPSEEDEDDESEGANEGIRGSEH
uniref:CADG domain-containing protein n=1 Tax=Ascaris lumbricoides TaxID=6252 RepID=A0A0M3HRS0_ASCLU